MLITKDGLKQVGALRNRSPVLAAAYIMNATKIAGRALIGTEPVPHLDYFNSDTYNDEDATDFSIIHSIFAATHSELPEEIASLCRTENLRNLIGLVWLTNQAVLRSLQEFPGLISSWRKFIESVLIQSISDNDSEFFKELIALIRSDKFYSDIKDALIALLTKYFGALPPTIEALQQQIQPQPQSEFNAPLPDVQEPESGVDPISIMEQVGQRVAASIKAANLVGNMQVPTFGRQDRELENRIREASGYHARVGWDDARKQPYIIYDVPIRTSASRQYQAIVGSLLPTIEAFRRKAELLVRSDLKRDISYFGRLSPNLLPKSLAANVPPFTRIEPQEESEIHLVFLVDESGSMGQGLYFKVHDSVPRYDSTSRAETLLGGASPIRSDRSTLAKITAITLYESIRTVARTDFFGYASEELPEPLNTNGAVYYVRKFTLPYALASITHTSGNADLQALHMALSVLKTSSAKHKIIVYLADGEISGRLLEDALKRAINLGIKVYWFDLSGHTHDRRSSALSILPRFPITSFDGALKALEAIWHQLEEWY